MKISRNYISKRFWNNKTVLITGINGFIGGNLAKLLSDLGANIIGISNSRNKNKFLKYERLDNKIIFKKIDLRNFKSINMLVQKNKIDICIHLAAQVDVNIAKTDPLTTFESNIVGTFNLLESLRIKKDIKSIIIASSDKSYGEYPLNELPYKETYDLRPIYPYDVSKACGDLISRSYASNLFNMPIIITRFANIYGPGQLNFTALIPDCILGNLSLRKFIPRSNGKNKRDFLFVNDVCNLYACLSYNLYKNKDLKGEIFNAGTKHGYTVDTIVKKICKQMNNDNLYMKIKDEFRKQKTIGEIQHQFMTYDKLQKYFNWKPEFSLEEGLSITIDWYKKFFYKYDYKLFMGRK